MTMPGPWTGTNPSMARRRLASAVSSWSAAGLPPDRSAALRSARSAVSADKASLARCRSSMRNASEVVSVPTRLRSTSAWLRICTVATSATSSAITATLIGPFGERRPGRRLRSVRADMRYLQAGVVGGKGDIRLPFEGDAHLELDLPCADVRQRGGIAEDRLHAVSIPNRRDRDRRRKGRALVDDDLAPRSGEGGQRGDPPSVHRDPFGPPGEQEVHHVLYVLEVDKVPGPSALVGTRHAVAEVDLDAWTVQGREAGMRTQVRDLVLKRLGRRRALGGLRLECVDLRPKVGDVAARVGVGGLQVLDVSHQSLVPGDLVG